MNLSGSEFFKRNFLDWKSNESWDAFRTVYLIALFYQMASKLKWPLGRMLKDNGSHPIPLFADFGIAAPNGEIFGLLYGLCLLLILISIFGWALRWTLPLIFILCFYIFGTELGLERPAYSNYVYHGKNMTIYLLLLFCLTAQPKAKGLLQFLGIKKNSLNFDYSWPLTCAKLTIAAFYFGSAYTKIVDTNFNWANGFTLQGILYTSYLSYLEPQTLWLANQHHLCQLLSILILLLEISFIFFCLHRKYVYFWVFGILTFHLSTSYFLNINFLKFHVLSFLVFIDWARVFRKLRELVAGTSQQN